MEFFRCEWCDVGPFKHKIKSKSNESNHSKIVKPNLKSKIMATNKRE